MSLGCISSAPIVFLEQNENNLVILLHTSECHLLSFDWSFPSEFSFISPKFVSRLQALSVLNFPVHLSSAIHWIRYIWTLEIKQIKCLQSSLIQFNLLNHSYSLRIIGLRRHVSTHTHTSSVYTKTITRAHCPLTIVIVIIIFQKLCD